MTEAPEPGPRPAATRTIGRWLRPAVALLLVAALAYLGRRYFGELSRLGEASPGWVGAMVVAFLLTRLAGAEVTRVALIALGHRLGRLEVFNLTLVRAYGNLLIPRSGFGALGVYLKLRHGVRFAEFGSLVLPVGLLELAVVGAAGLIALGAWSTQHGTDWPRWIAWVFALAALGGAATLALRIPAAGRWPGAVGRFLTDLGQAWGKLGARELLLHVALLQVLMLLLRVLRLWMAFRAIGISTDHLGLCVASLLADLAFLLGLTPSGLGLREAALVQTATFAGVAGGVAMTAAILDRIVVTLTVIVSAQVALKKMFGGGSR